MSQAHPDPAATDIAGRMRAALQEPLDRQLAPLGRRAMAALGVKPGDRVLDIGCGAGQTSAELADAVGPAGQVLGVDLSAVMLEAAARWRAGRPQLGFAQGDAQVFPFEAETFDAAFSRFGVMFFDDPPAAFANIRRALKPGAPLAFICWRALEENDLDIVPLRAAWPHLPPQSPEPGAAKAFSFADPDCVRAILAAAGFEAIDITAHDDAVTSGDLPSMLELALGVGSLGAIVRAAPELRARVIDGVREALVAGAGPEGVTLNAATWVVKAQSPPSAA